MAFNGAPQKEWEPGEEFQGLNCVGQGVAALSKDVGVLIFHLFNFNKLSLIVGHNTYNTPTQFLSLQI